jgi:hypothetical protein
LKQPEDAPKVISHVDAPLSARKLLLYLPRRYFGRAGAYAGAGVLDLAEQEPHRPAHQIPLSAPQGRAPLSTGAQSQCDDARPSGPVCTRHGAEPALGVERRMPGISLAVNGRKFAVPSSVDPTLPLYEYLRSSTPFKVRA